MMEAAIYQCLRCVVDCSQEYASDCSALLHLSQVHKLIALCLLLVAN